MKRTTKTLVVSLATAGTLAVGTGVAFAATSPSPSATKATTKHATHQAKAATTVAQDKARYDAFVTKVTARMETVKTKVAANQKLTADQKSTLTADANKIEADAKTVQGKVDAATTKAEIKAAHDGHPVRADLKKLHEDAKAARVADGTAKKS